MARGSRKRGVLVHYRRADTIRPYMGYRAVRECRGGYQPPAKMPPDDDRPGVGGYFSVTLIRRLVSAMREAMAATWARVMALVGWNWLYSLPVRIPAR